MGRRKVGKYARRQMRIFQCEECGTQFIIPKRKGHSTASGYVKHFYCWRCMDCPYFAKMFNEEAAQREAEKVKEV